MSPLIRKNRLPARIRGWAGTATGGHIHVVHISHTHPPKELIQTQRIYLLGKFFKKRKNLCVDKVGSPDRGILCVDKIGSPGKPATPRLRLDLRLIRKNRLPARIRGCAGTATGRHIHVVHISHTPTERAHTDPKKISFGKKNPGRVKVVKFKNKSEKHFYF